LVKSPAILRRKKLAENRPRDVLKEGERVSWSEFVNRLKTQLGIDINHYGTKIFNDASLKFEPEVVDEKSQVWVSLAGGGS